MVTYVAKVSAPGAFPVHTRVGAQLEPYCSGLGKVLLAALPDEEVESFILDGELIALTPYTITTAAALRAELKTGARARLCRGRPRASGQYALHRGAGAGPEGRAVAALSATDDAERMTPERQLEVRDALFDAAAVLRQKLYPAPAPIPAIAGRSPRNNAISASPCASSARARFICAWNCGILHQPQRQDGAELLAGHDVAAKMHAADQPVLGIFRGPRQDRLGFLRHQRRPAPRPWKKPAWHGRWDRKLAALPGLTGVQVLRLGSTA